MSYVEMPEIEDEQINALRFANNNASNNPALAQDLDSIKGILFKYGWNCNVHNYYTGKYCGWGKDIKISIFYFGNSSRYFSLAERPRKPTKKLIKFLENFFNLELYIVKPGGQTEKPYPGLIASLKK